MKIVKNIINFIVMTILTVSLVAFILIKLISSTVLDKSYIIKKFEDFDYYSNNHEIVVSNFENYMYQSGLDLSVFDNISNVEDVKEDVNIIISNIYDNEEKDIDTSKITNRLNENIDKTGVRTKGNKKAIDKLVKIFSDEYRDSILPKKYEKATKEVFNKVNNVINKSYKFVIIGIISSVVLVIIINVKSLLKILQSFGISFVSSGIFSLAIKIFIDSKLYIEGIKIYNDTLSSIIVMIAQEIINKIVIFGICLIIVGFLFILIFAIFKKDKNKEKVIRRKKVRV